MITLEQAIESHTKIGQAVGILMERFGIESDQALAMLRRHSQDHNIKLRAAATLMVSERRLPGQGSQVSRRQGRAAMRRVDDLATRQAR
jgi:hypothetical protein